MTDIDTGGAELPEGIAQGEPPGVRILAQFIRDLSFENPKAPDSLRGGEGSPKIDLQVEMNARGREDGLFEVDLKLTATATNGGATMFVAELLYGGLFGISGVPPEELEPVLLVECPRYMFPFARRIIADVTSEGGFPPFLLEPIDFGAIYQARKAQTDQQIGHA